MRLCGGHGRQLAAELGKADHRLNMWLKAVLMEDRRPKLKADRGGLPYPPKNTIILKKKKSPMEEKLFLVLKPDFGTLLLTLKSRESQIVLHKKSLLTKGGACPIGHCVPQEQFLPPVPGTPLSVPHKRTKMPTPTQIWLGSSLPGTRAA